MESMRCLVVHSGLYWAGEGLTVQGMAVLYKASWRSTGSGTTGHGSAVQGYLARAWMVQLWLTIFNSWQPFKVAGALQDVTSVPALM